MMILNQLTVSLRTMTMNMFKSISQNKDPLNQLTASVRTMTQNQLTTSLRIMTLNQLTASHRTMSLNQLTAYLRILTWPCLNMQLKMTCTWRVAVNCFIFMPSVNAIIYSFYQYKEDYRDTEAPHISPLSGPFYPDTEAPHTSPL